jgi:Di-haem cytochrome c peroxidase
MKWMFAVGSMFALAALTEAQTAGLGPLPVGSELGDEAIQRPREVFRSESAGGRRSYLVSLGDAAFSSPLLLGGTARAAGISCNTCHVNGTSNPRLYIPGLSTRPGTFDTTGHLFNVRADNGVLDPLTIPSLRGAHLLSPYGHDGRTVSLLDFVRNVIVNEFAGPEPSRPLLDAVVAYIEDIDFVPNPRLNAGGRLSEPVSEAERRGEALFYKPFPHEPNLNCAACHVPGGAFVDHRQHDVGSGGLFKTPTLLNANVNGPYFHDGRYSSYAQVVAHFDRVFYLGLSAADRQDLVAYLNAIGEAPQALPLDSIEAHMTEIHGYLSLLEAAILSDDQESEPMAFDILDRELRELTEYYPDRKNATVSGGAQERLQARAALKKVVLKLREVADELGRGHTDKAPESLAEVRQCLDGSSAALAAAAPWSLFNRDVHDAHFSALRQIYRAGLDPALAPRVHYDND